MNKFFGFKTPLCNSRHSSFTVNGVTYNSMDQYITAMKAKLFNDKDAYNTAMKQPRFVRQIPVNGYEDKIWALVAKKILYKGLKEKFKQNPGCRKCLLKTGNKKLVYCDPDDKVHGIGMSIWDPDASYPTKWHGKNILGKTLMKIRSELQNEIACFDVFGSLKQNIQKQGRKRKVKHVCKFCQ